MKVESSLEKSLGGIARGGGEEEGSGRQGQEREEEQKEEREKPTKVRLRADRPWAFLATQGG